MPPEGADEIATLGVVKKYAPCFPIVILLIPPSTIPVIAVAVDATPTKVKV